MQAKNSRRKNTRHRLDLFEELTKSQNLRILKTGSKKTPYNIIIDKIDARDPKNEPYEPDKILK